MAGIFDQTGVNQSTPETQEQVQGTNEGQGTIFGPPQRVTQIDTDDRIEGSVEEQGVILGNPDQVDVEVEPGQTGEVIDQGVIFGDDGNFDVPLPTGATGPQGPRGATGPQGPQGAQGPAGPAGPKGNQGPVGPTGPQGMQGPQGDPGPQGMRGPQGDKGDQGERGPTGATGPAGATGPMGAPGADGQDGASVTAVGTVTQGTDTTPTVIQFVTTDADGNNRGIPNLIEVQPGPRGPAGPQGSQGPQGNTGPAGMDGMSLTAATGPTTTLPAGSEATASVVTDTTSGEATFTFGIPRGANGTNGMDGAAGRGITNIAGVGQVTPGQPRTIRVTFTDNTTQDFTVPAGAPGTGGGTGGGNPVIAGQFNSMNELVLTLQDGTTVNAGAPMTDPVDTVETTFDATTRTLTTSVDGVSDTVVIPSGDSSLSAVRSTNGAQFFDSNTNTLNIRTDVLASDADLIAERIARTNADNSLSARINGKVVNVVNVIDNGNQSFDASTGTLNIRESVDDPVTSVDVEFNDTTRVLTTTVNSANESSSDTVVIPQHPTSVDLEFNPTTRTLTASIDGVSDQVVIPGGGTNPDPNPTPGDSGLPPLERAINLVQQGYNSRAAMRDARGLVSTATLNYDDGETIAEEIERDTRGLTMNVRYDGAQIVALGGAGRVLEHRFVRDARGLTMEDFWAFVASSFVNLYLTNNGTIVEFGDVTNEVILTDNGTIVDYSTNIVVTDNGTIVEFT